MSNIAKFKVDLLKANNLVPGALFPGFSGKANEYVVPQSREILQTFVCWEGGGGLAPSIQTCVKFRNFVKRYLPLFKT